MEKMNNKSKYILFFAFFIFVAILLNRVLLIFSYNYDLQGVEQTFVYYIQRCLHKLTLYTNPEEYPFFLNQYTPLSTVTISFVCKLFGISEENVKGIFIAGRSLSLLYNLISVLLVYKITLLITKDAIKSLLAGVLIFCFFTPHHASLRPDSLKALMILSTVFFIALYITKQKNIFLIFVVLFSFLSFLSKQDGIIILPIVSIWFLFNKKFKELIVCSIVALCLIAITLLIIHHKQPYFFSNVFLGLNQGINLLYFKELLPYISVYFFMFASACVLLVKNKDTLNNKLINFISISGLIYFLFSLLISLKWGSSPTYFFEFNALWTITILLLISKRFVALTIIILMGFNLTIGKEVNFKLYNFSKEKEFKQAYYNNRIIAKKITYEFPNKEYICLDKNLSLHLYPKLLFATFEAEYPELMYCNNQFTSLPEKIFNYHLTLGELDLLIIKKQECNISRFINDVFKSDSNEFINQITKENLYLIEE